MSFLDLAKKRCATRAYQPVPFSQEHIDDGVDVLLADGDRCV